MTTIERQMLVAPLRTLLQEDAWGKLPRLHGASARLFTASVHTYDYAHHASLGWDAAGLHAFWSNGRDGEDLPGQIQSWSRCAAQGCWGTPQVLARAPMLDDITTTAINGGTANGSPTLTAFYSEYKGRPQDGAGGTGKWSSPMHTAAQVYEPSTGIWRAAPAYLEDYLLNEGPRRTARGRWVMTGEDHDGHTRIAYSDQSEPGDPGWVQVPVVKGEGAVFKNEPSWFQRPDGTLALWLRDDGGSHRLWLAESQDEGGSWSEPAPTDIPDATSKCHCGKLSNGLYYLIHNPNTSGLRIPLIISLSEDGLYFSKAYILRDEDTAPRLPGRFKGAGYQYPNSLEFEGRLQIIYSVNKEEIEVQSIALSELSL
ncbi:MAG: exo-alpha-sialidase [Chloroflexi bacterium]|nr:exo-alpha-sialidase [Chloroflexota bacterium]